MSENYMRVHFKVLGGHTHCAVFTGKKGYTLGKAGDLCMTNEEFRAWHFATHHFAEFVTNDPESFRMAEGIDERQAQASEGPKP